ncbi:MAG: hypothetical protein MUF85_03280 [Patescibacteria group bacterium]|nr:hypothetical protein [Patescibacteria group bacterium]
MYKKSNLLAIAGWATVLTVAVLLWVNRFDINDYFALKNYSPSDNISELANNSGMNQKGQDLFYIGKPELLSGPEFNKSCTTAEQTKVLGCYVSIGSNKIKSIAGIIPYNIYIYDINKPELEGIQEVTAAHEMLHAAYDRLSSAEKTKINQQLLDYYNNSANSSLKATIESYKAKDSTVVPNELHSILGTEIRSLPIDLETYYRRYFDNRNKVVDYYEAYEKVFSDKNAEIDRLAGELRLRKGQISQLETDLGIKNQQITRIKNDMDRYANNGDIALYNSLVPKYNSLAVEFNKVVQQLRDLIDSYNRLVEQHNKLILVQQDLVNSIDSNYKPL